MTKQPSAGFMQSRVCMLFLQRVYAIYHLTFPWIKAGFIMCSPSSSQHFHLSGFQKNMSIRKTHCAIQRGKKKAGRRKSREQELPHAPINAPRPSSLFPRIVYFATARRISKRHWLVCHCFSLPETQCSQHSLHLIKQLKANNLYNQCSICFHL